MDVFNSKSKFLSEQLGRSDKQKILDYLTGTEILEVGCGSGINLNLIEANYKCNLTGMDISEKAIETLKLKKKIQNHSWNVVLGNALHLKEYFNKNSLDVIIFCSVIHELFSYINFRGSKFNYDTIDYVLNEAYDLLKIGGRIIIRDGIMSEDNSLVKIKFKDEDGINFFRQYVQDFKGRKLIYHIEDNNELKLHRNDAMEFLYTYTWGYEAYQYEVQEQYGYFTPSQYKDCINRLFGDKVKLLEFNHYLQDGYVKNLKSKVELCDLKDNSIKLPDSNCILILEKIK